VAPVHDGKADKSPYVIWFRFNPEKGRGTTSSLIHASQIAKNKAIKIFRRELTDGKPASSTEPLDPKARSCH
jgi:hypothetical protein